MTYRSGPLSAPKGKPVVDWSGDVGGTTFDAIIQTGIPFTAYSGVVLQPNTNALVHAMVSSLSTTYTITYGGQTMSLLGTVSGSVSEIKLYGLLNPPLSASDFIFNSSNADHRIGWGFAGFKGVNTAYLAAAFKSVVSEIDNVGTDSIATNNPVSSAPGRKIFGVGATFSVDWLSMSHHQLGLWNASAHSKLATNYADGAASVTLSGAFSTNTLDIMIAVDIAPP